MMDRLLRVVIGYWLAHPPRRVSDGLICEPSRPAQGKHLALDLVVAGVRLVDTGKPCYLALIVQAPNRHGAKSPGICDKELGALFHLVLGGTRALYVASGIRGLAHLRPPWIT